MVGASFRALNPLPSLTFTHSLSHSFSHSLVTKASVDSLPSMEASATKLFLYKSVKINSIFPPYNLEFLFTYDLDTLFSYLNIIYILIN